jgi:glycosyltransferase involved in cell wall biosynthesis
MLAHELSGPPYSFTVHGPEEFDRAERLGLGEKVRRSAFVIAVSSYGRSQLYRWAARAHWPKVSVVRCGLERAFHDVPPTPPPAAPRLVCVGRLCQQKGQLLLLEALARVAAKGIVFALIFAGDGELRDEIEAAIAKHTLEKQVRVTGWLSGDQVRAEILAARALVLPSFAEGLPVVIIEAMSLRRPVIATSVAGIPELVRPGENGWLCPPGDVDELALALEDVLSCPVEQLRAMGEAARQRVLDRHSIDVEAAKLAALIKQP